MAETEKKQLTRPPVVVVMGHVDHGKTTLLDFVRKANIADKEAGGITQSVGAYEITHNEKLITFIDTPGHQAFTKMRSRGASIADIAILVVAADDGVNVQTKEVIGILNEAKIPFVVAINKIDKNNANVEKAKSDLAQNGVMLEGFGGSVSFQPLSAKTGEGVNELLDLILLTAEVEDFKYDPKAPVKSYVLEAKKDPFSGVTATVIIKDGTLHVKDEVYSPSASAKIKGLKNFLNKPVKELTASSPAVISGFTQIPETGDMVTTDKELLLNADERGLENADERGLADGENGIPFIVKSQDAGSLEAMCDALLTIPHPDETKRPIILGRGVGEVSDGDVNAAISSGAAIVAYKVKTNNAAQNLLRDRKMKVFESEIIYKILEEIETEFSGAKQQMVEGKLEVLAVFNQENHGTQIIGGQVVEGELKEQREVEIFRREAQVGTGKITNLQQDKKEVHSVASGNECGILFSSQTLVKKGDFLIQRPE